MLVYSDKFLGYYVCMSSILCNLSLLFFAELDKLLENAPSPVIAQHAARISSMRKRVLALNMLLRSIQRRIDNIDRLISTGVTSGTVHHKNYII
jgi:hypothetical protein